MISNKNIQFQMAVLIVTFILPLIAMIYSYTGICMVVYKSEKNLSSTRNSGKSNRSFSQRASVKVVALALVSF